MSPQSAQVPDPPPGGSLAPGASGAPVLDAEAGEGPSSPAAQRADALEMCLLVLALALGLLRFVRLGRWSLWYDEVLTWGDSHSSLHGISNDAGYMLIRWTVEALGGEPTETALRLLPALVGFAVIPLTAWAFRPLAGGRRAALAALVVAISAWELQWSQTARFYTFVQAIGLVGAGVALRGVLAGSWWRAALGILIASLGILFHLSGAIVAAGLGGALALVPPTTTPGVRRAGRAAFLLFVIPGLLASPLLLDVWQKFAASKPVDSSVSGVAHFALSTGSYVTPALAAIAAAAGLMILAWRDRRGVFPIMVVVLAGAALTVASTQATVSAQYAFVLFPWIALIAAWPIGLEQLSRVRAAPIAFVLALALPQLAESALYLTVQQGQRPRWREAARLVAQRREPGDLVVSLPATVTEFYLTGARETDVRTPDSVVHLDRHQPRSYETWAREGRPMWLVLRTDYLNTFKREDRAHLELFLSEQCRLIRRFPVFVEARDLSIEVWRFR